MELLLGGSSRVMEKIVKPIGITSLDKYQPALQVP